MCAINLNRENEQRCVGLVDDPCNTAVRFNDKALRVCSRFRVMFVMVGMMVAQPCCVPVSFARSVTRGKTLRDVR